MFCRQAWSFRNSGKHRLLQRNIVRFLLFLIIEEKLGRVVLFEHLEGGLWLLGLTRQLGKVTSLWMIRSGSAEYALNRLPPPHSSSFRLVIFNPFVCSFIPRRRTTIGWFRHAFARVKSTRIGTGSIAAMPCVTDNFFAGSQQYIHLQCLKKWQRSVLLGQHNHPSVAQDESR